MRHAYSSRQKLICVLAACITYLACISANALLAQNTPITSSGLNTQISGPIPVGGQVQYNITGGTRPNGGPNLFHSFGEFGVPNNTIANFLNNPRVETTNILGRVTGGNISNIFGAIQTDGFGSANLFLMNPTGFLFGPNAAIHVGGMVSFTSADYLKFEDGKRFNAIPSTADALLSASPVAAFGFLGPNSASIAIQGGTLEVADGKTLSFIGGPRVFTTETGVTVPSGVSMSGGSLSAPNGLIYMATVTSPGEVPVPTLSGSPLGSPGSPSSGPAVIRIRSGEFVMDRALLIATTTSNTAQSPIEINVQGSLELRNVSSISTKTLTSGYGSSVAINILADTLTLKNGSTVDTSVASGATGRGGDIAIQVRQASLHGSTIKSDTEGQGDAGTISIRGNDSISLVDSAVVSTATTFPVSTSNGGLIRLHAPRIEVKGSQILSSTDGPGNAGSILIETQNLTVTGAGDLNDFSAISARTEGPGQAGQITIRGTDGLGSHAQDIILSGNSQIVSETVSSVLTLGGNAGSVAIDTARLSLGKSSGISTASSGTAPSGLSPGNAGNITVNATDAVTVFGGLITTSTETSGRGGIITINTGTLNLTGGGQLTSSSFLTAPAGAVIIQGVQGQGSMANSVTISGKGEFGNTSGIFTNTKGSGSGGNISVSANSIMLQKDGMLSAETSGTAASAIGGTITVNSNQVQLESGGSITANSAGAADAGNIDVSATNGLTMQNGSSITTRVVSNATGSTARGGDITVTTSPTATVNIQDSTISASVPGSGDGGNVTIDPYFVILQNGRILSQTDQGTGGNIKITARVFLPDAGTVISADATRGVIQSPYAPAGGKIQPMVNRPLQATLLLNQSCAAVAGGQFSSFTVAGNRLLIEPGEWLSSPLTLAISGSHDDTRNNKRLQTSLDEPMGERSLLSLRQIAPPGFLIKAFAAPSSANCAS